MPTKKITDVLQAHTDEWMVLDGVGAVGIGEQDNTPCITICIQSNSKNIRSKIPKDIEGFQVVITETGTFQTH